MTQDLSQGSIIKCLAVYDEPFWREDGLSGQGFAPYGLVSEIYDNSPPSGSVGVIVTFLAGEKAESAARMLPEQPVTMRRVANRPERASMHGV